MELTFAQLEQSASENGLCAYYCDDGFKTILADVQEENTDLTETELKEEVIFRLLDENLDYGAFSEQAWEFDGEHDAEHSKRMEIRAAICEKVAHSWVAAEVYFLRLLLKGDIVESILKRYFRPREHKEPMRKNRPFASFLLVAHRFVQVLGD